MDVTAPHSNVDEFVRRLRAPSRLPHISEPSSRLSPCAPNTGKESIEQLDVRSSPQSHLKPSRPLQLIARFLSIQSPPAFVLDGGEDGWARGCGKEVRGSVE